MFIEIVSFRLLQKATLEIQLLIQDGFGKKGKIRYPPLYIFGIVGIWSIVLMMKAYFKYRQYKVNII